MLNLKIIGWTNFDCCYPTKEYNNNELDEIISLIIDEIINENYVFSGEEHQYAKTGVPVFSDGTCFRASMKCWANIMANIYVDPDGKPYDLMEFYSSLGKESNMPLESVIDIKPAILEDVTSGYMIQEDSEFINMNKSYFYMDYMRLRLNYMYGHSKVIEASKKYKKDDEYFNKLKSEIEKL